MQRNPGRSAGLSLRFTTPLRIPSCQSDMPVVSPQAAISAGAFRHIPYAISVTMREFTTYRLDDMVAAQMVRILQ